MVEQLPEWLTEAEQSGVRHHLGPESRVQEVHHRMLSAADIQIYRQPVVHRAPIEGGLALVGIGKSEKVPGRASKSVHCVRFAPGRAATRGAGGVDEFGHVR